MYMTQIEETFCFLAALTLATIGLTAQPGFTILPLWPEGSIPCQNTLTLELRQDTAIGLLSLQVQQPELHLYQPPGSFEQRGTVIVCPGGGYYLQAWDWEGTALAHYLNHYGYTVGVLRYRLPYWEHDSCRSQVAEADVLRSVQLLRARGAEFGLDTGRIAVMGFSAGGHLAACAAVHSRSPSWTAADSLERMSSRPNLSILVYPVISMDTVDNGHPGSLVNLLGSNPSAALRQYFSLETQVTAATPPTFLVHATNDDGVVPNNSIRYYQALRQAGVPAALHLYQEGGHGFATAQHLPPDTDCKAWLPTLLDWLSLWWK
ncbi:MAG: alpha/beta hydrolase [Lewinella sp.]|nr:alpha/beta hydrolase [Lewinella sp.]